MPRLEPLEIRALLSGAGSLDPTFGNGGVVVRSLTSQGDDGVSRVILQPDGKLIGVGTGMARFNVNGTLDPTFGSGGKVALSSRAEGAAIYPAGTPNSGKIVTASTTSTSRTGTDFSLTRYNANGSVDTTFGNRGTATTDFSQRNDSPLAVVVQPDGKVIAAGSSVQQVSPGVYRPVFALARYDTAGRLDPTFGNGGKVLTEADPGDRYTTIYDMALQPDGRIVVSGGEWYEAVARYNTDGSLDSGFGPNHNGVVVVTSASLDPALGLSWPGSTRGVAIQQDGKILAIGLATGPNGDGWLLTRLDAAGNFDPAFGDRGALFYVPASRPTADHHGFDVAVQADGRIVALGRTASSTSFYVARFDSSGALDPGFGAGGLVETPVGLSSGGNRLVLQADGKIVAAGSTWDGKNNDWALVRYLATATTATASLRTASLRAGIAQGAGATARSDEGHDAASAHRVMKPAVGWARRRAILGAWGLKEATSSAVAPHRHDQTPTLNRDLRRPH